jgi:hypothetical protein
MARNLASLLSSIPEKLSSMDLQNLPYLNNIEPAFSRYSYEKFESSISDGDIWMNGSSMFQKPWDHWK